MRHVMRFLVLSNENEHFRLEVEMYRQHTFLNLHNVIQVACDFHANQMSSFFVVNSDWEKQKELTLIKMNEYQGLYPTEWMGNVDLGRLFTHRGARLLYMFDLFSERYFVVYLKAEYISHHSEIIPRMLKLQGVPLRQLIVGEPYIDNLLDAFSIN